MQGDARQLWRSIRAILALPGETRLFTGHDYQPGGQEPEWDSTVREQREANKHLIGGQTEESYVAMRAEEGMKLEVKPDPNEEGESTNGMHRIPADLVFELEQGLQVGYRGWYECGNKS